SHGYVVAAADFPLTALTTAGGESDKHVDLQVGDVSFIASQLYAQSNDPQELLAGILKESDGFAVAGHSTGGTLALVVGRGKGGDARVKAAISLAPDSCFFAESFFAGRDTPLLVAQGTNDKLVPPATSGTRDYHLATGTKRLATFIGGTHMFFSDFNI